MSSVRSIPRFAAPHAFDGPPPPSGDIEEDAPPMVSLLCSRLPDDGQPQSVEAVTEWFEAVMADIDGGSTSMLH